MDVRYLSHISSFPVAQKIQTAAAQSNLKVVRSHLSAKSPALVFADADLKAAVEQTALSIGFLNGQSCMATSRIYVEESVASDFKALFRQKFDAFPLGDPRDPGAFVGPQRSEVHYERVMSFIDAGQQYGTMTMGGSIEDGLFIKPNSELILYFRTFVETGLSGLLLGFIGESGTKYMGVLSFDSNVVAV
jgi:aldehyde dehydrogenase (NAD+)